MVKVQVDALDQKKHYDATVYGGARAGSIGLGSAFAGSLALQRFSPAYRTLTLPLKAFALTAVTSASFIIGADAASRRYELSKYAIGSGTDLETETRRDIELEKQAGIYVSARGEKRSGRELSTKDALVNFGQEHRYGVVFASWAASMVGSFAYISVTPLSFAQKLVQARMVAQGLTVAVLIASAGLSSIPTEAGGQNEEEIKRQARENSTYKWKKGSPHDLAHPHKNVESTTSE